MIDELAPPPAWLDAAERDHDNLRAALHWFGRREAHDRALALVARLFWLWYLRGHMTEGLVRFREVVAAAGVAAHTPAGASVLRQAGVFARYAGDPAQARAYVEAGLAVAEALGDPVRRGQCLSYLGGLARQDGDFAADRAFQEQALVLLRRANEEPATASVPDRLPPSLAAVLDRLSQALAGLGEAEDARRLQEEALALRRASGDALGTGWSLVHLGDLAVDRDDLVAARRAYGECLARRGGCPAPDERRGHGPGERRAGAAHRGGRPPAGAPRGGRRRLGRGPDHAAGAGHRRRPQGCPGPRLSAVPPHAIRDALAFSPHGGLGGTGRGSGRPLAAHDRAGGARALVHHVARRHRVHGLPGLPARPLPRRPGR